MLTDQAIESLDRLGPLIVLSAYAFIVYALAQHIGWVDGHLDRPHHLSEGEHYGKLIRRHLLTGCTCGCRGDFVLTPKGEALLAEKGAGT